MARLPLYRCCEHDDRLYNTKRLARAHVTRENRSPHGDPSECAITGVAECGHCEKDLRDRIPPVNSDKQGGKVFVYAGDAYCCRRCKLTAMVAATTGGDSA